MIINLSKVVFGENLIRSSCLVCNAFPLHDYFKAFNVDGTYCQFKVPTGYVAQALHYVLYKTVVQVILIKTKSCHMV